MPTSTINLTDEELVYITAAVGRVTDPPNLKLYEYLHSSLHIGEKHDAEELASKMQFSGTDVELHSRKV